MLQLPVAVGVTPYGRYRSGLAVKVPLPTVRSTHSGPSKPARTQRCGDGRRADYCMLVTEALQPLPVVSPDDSEVVAASEKPPDMSTYPPE